MSAGGDWNEMRYRVQTWPASMVLDLVKHSTGPVNEMARREMASRGLDEKGNWIGFPAAEARWMTPA